MANLTCGEAKREVEVNTQMSNLESQIARHEGNIKRLVDRLQPIITSHPKTQEENSPDKISLCPLANDLRHYSDRIETLNIILEDSLSEIQI